MESYPKPAKVFLEAVGVELDDPAQKIPDIK